ncbi:MAG: BspA family leucine-rich repeat surface protein, partial [Erysipelotrichaceae bacterium]
VNYTTATSKVVDDMIATKNPGDNVVKGRKLDYISVTSLTSSDATNQELKAWDSKQLNVTVNPANADNKTLTWSSSDASIATVSDSGNVVGVSKGNAIITAKSVDGPSISFTFNVIDGTTEISKSLFNQFVNSSTAETIKFIRGNGEPAGYSTKADLSTLQNGRIMGYSLPNGIFEIRSTDIIMAPKDLSSFFKYHVNLSDVEFNNFDTSNVTNMNSMFDNCYNLTFLDLSSFNTSNVTDMSCMFYNCKSLFFLNLSSFNTSNVVNLSQMFYTCFSLTSLDLSSFNTSNVTDMSYMFSTCSKLKSLNLSNFNTSNVIKMNSVFYSCSNLTSLDISNFNTSKATDMNQMFNSCSSLTSLNVSNFNTSKVTDMGGMFSSCSSLTSLNLSNFNTTNVINMTVMFRYSSNLTSLNLSNFNTSNVISMNEMFKNSLNLITEISITNTSVANVEFYSMFGGTSSIRPAKTVVNYTTATSKLVDDMIATKSPGSNVVKGRKLY